MMPPGFGKPELHGEGPVPRVHHRSHVGDPALERPRPARTSKVTVASAPGRTSVAYRSGTPPVIFTGIGIDDPGHRRSGSHHGPHLDLPAVQDPGDRGPNDGPGQTLLQEAQVRGCLLGSVLGLQIDQLRAHPILLIEPFAALPGLPGHVGEGPGLVHLGFQKLGVHPEHGLSGLDPSALVHQDLPNDPALFRRDRRHPCRPGPSR